MRVAGIGCRRNVAPGDVLAAIDAVLVAHTLGRSALGAVATAALKKDEAAIRMAARCLGLPLVVVAEDDLRAASAFVLSRSSASFAASGTNSVSEAAALAAAGRNSRLLGPRLITGNVTCAIAAGRDEL